MPYCLPAGRTSHVEKCLVLITSSDCLHLDETFKESESLKPSNSISKLAGMVIKHFFSRILLFLSWLGLFFGFFCSSEDQLFFWRLLTHSLHILCHGHACCNQELNKMASGSLLSYISLWAAQGNRFMGFSVKEYFQMNPSSELWISVLIFPIFPLLQYIL